MSSSSPSFVIRSIFPSNKTSLFAEPEEGALSANRGSCAMAAAKAEAEALPYLFFTLLFFFQLYKMVFDTLL